MNLIHECPRCHQTHEMDYTPEPDQLCPICDLEENGNIAELKITFRTGNCPMKKEEGQWLENLIKNQCSTMHIKLEKVEWYGLD